MSAETSSKYNKLHKRVKIAIGRSKNSKENVETLDSKKGVQSDKKAQSRKIKGNDVRSVDDKLYKRDNTGRMSMKSKTKDEGMRTGKEGYKAVIGRDRGFKQEGFEVGIDGDRGFRKRIYADRAKDEKNTFRNNVTMPNRKDISKSGWNKLKDDFVKDKRTTKGPRDSEQFSRSNSPIGRRRSNENESLDRKGRTGLTANSRSVYKVKNFELDGSEYDMPKAGAKRKPDQNKQLHWNQNKGAAESHEKYAKKKIQDKKSSADDSAPIDDRPKKRKRVIRIDPHDITNKRLDDGIATNDNIIEKKEDSEKNKNVEMSMNAQFRAIQPSPSILSFVEENLLGRRREIELRRAGYNTDLSVPLDNIPFSTSSERERMEETDLGPLRNIPTDSRDYLKIQKESLLGKSPRILPGLMVFRNKLTFFAAAKISSSIPPPDLPEIAFAGRSNVGKSSLLNALTRQWGVVRTSDKPGLTQTINFFKLGSKVCLVDLPGYGFAYAKEEVKEAWEELVKEYVSTRVGLKQVCLLIDTKWGMKPRDHELINLMERSQTKYQIVLTKTDTVFPIDVARRAMQIEESLKAKKSAVQPVMMVSSKSGAGIRSLRTMFTKIARFAKL